MDFKTLSASGNIAFYNSCEVTEIFLYRKSDKAIFNFFTLAVFEEKAYNGLNKIFLGDRISVNDDFSIGIQRYWLSVTEAEIRFDILKNQNKWSANSTIYSQFPQLKYLPKQYIPSVEGNRINHILKNNYHNGSYSIEFFDESKSNFEFLLKIEALSKFNDICEKIKMQVPIDLSVVRDRIGNFIFQFPVNIIEAHSKALSTWDGVDMSFSWHNSISLPPDCLLQVESTLDKNYMGSVIEEYNQTPTQKIIIGNLDQINHIKVWRKEPSLILTTFSGSYIREFISTIGIVSPEPRLFEVEGEMQKVDISSSDKRTRGKTDASYTTYINNNLYDAEKKQLEKRLAFKQYKNFISDVALDDIRKLIGEKDKNGVYLWDPYLSSLDILKTLYYSKTANVKIRAIGAFNKDVRRIYETENEDENPVEFLEKLKEYINKNKCILENPNHNNYGLNLEFRIQHSSFGWAFHDRFLIFPSSKLRRSQVYSLGTSINSYGNNHHILQEVSHPQPVVDAFNELWEKLNHPECLVWKHSK
ncbi:MAG: hypothetical protein CMC96_03680 [Flavobacteriales bacterium]|nr:hypothetical protein [Flavobacteriales bacterium]|tara:strand:- start:1891 stop:3480 length:1590 start_codon:yes stop_codon:yes gene_type:complete